MPRRLSFQLYSARHFQPLSTTLTMLAKAGYREVEGFGDVYDQPETLRKLLDSNGLTMPTGHFGLDMLENEQPRVLEIAKTLSMRHIYAPYLMDDERPKDAAGWQAFGKRLAAVGESVRGEGFSFGWHNHDFEFERLPSGEMPLDVMFEAAPMLDWECDVAWVARAHADPVAWIKRYADRITSVHVKDLAPEGNCADEDGWADVGEGVVDWTACFAALKNSRVLHYIMEHDNPNDLERFARRSFDYVSKI